MAQFDDVGDQVWNEIFAEFMARTGMNEEEVWKQFFQFYKLQRYRKQDEQMYYSDLSEATIQIPRMKSLQDLMKDFLSDGGDGHACDINVQVPKYFYYEGKEYILNFENLD